MNRIFSALLAALLVCAALPGSAANLRIDQESAASALGSADIFLCEQNVGTTNNTKFCTAAQLNTWVQSQTPTASSSVLGLAKCDGITVTCPSGVMQTGATVVAGTTQTVTANQWKAGTSFTVTTAAQTLTLPVSSGLNTNGGIAIQTIGQSVTLAPNAADAINGGTTGASITIASGLTAYVTTDGAGNVRASPITGGSSSSGANPTATASDTAVNGSASTFMRSDGAPAIQKGSSSVFGVVKVDNSTITASGGVISAVGGGGSGAVTLVGSTCTFNNTTTNCAFTGLTGSEYQLRCYGLISGNTAHVLGIQYGTGVGPTWDTGGTSYQRNVLYETGNTPGAANVTASYMMGLTAASSGNSSTYFTANLHNLNNSGGATFKGMEAASANFSGAGAYQAFHEDSFYIGSTTAVTAVRFIDTDGSPANIIGGACSLYAIAS